MTSSQVLVKGGIVSSVKLIDGHLPDWVRPTGAVLSISVALMWQPNNEKLYHFQYNFPIITGSAECMAKVELFLEEQ